MYELENDHLRIEVDHRGAELQSITHKASGRNMLWNGDPAWWNRRAPHLFPLVGGLGPSGLVIDGQTWRPRKHGFARDMDFTLLRQEAEELVFELKESPATLEEYPFDFTFRIRYRLEGDAVFVGATVRSTHDLWFSYGGHPAFAIPQRPGEAFSDYRIEFATVEAGKVHYINGDGLLDGSTGPFPGEATTIPLEPGLFDRDALIWKQPSSTWVQVVHRRHGHGIRLEFEGFPYLGIWSKPGAPFVCLEPWFGLADHVNATGRPQDKEGLRHLPAGERFMAEYGIRILEGVPAS